MGRVNNKKKEKSSVIYKKNKASGENGKGLLVRALGCRSSRGWSPISWSPGRRVWLRTLVDRTAAGACPHGHPSPTASKAKGFPAGAVAVRIPMQGRPTIPTPAGWGCRSFGRVFRAPTSRLHSDLPGGVGERLCALVAHPQRLGLSHRVSHLRECPDDGPLLCPSEATGILHGFPEVVPETWVIGANKVPGGCVTEYEPLEKLPPFITFGIHSVSKERQGQNDRA